MSCGSDKSHSSLIGDLLAAGSPEEMLPLLDFRKEVPGKGDKIVIAGNLVGFRVGDRNRIARRKEPDLGRRGVEDTIEKVPADAAIGKRDRTLGRRAIASQRMAL